MKLFLLLIAFLTTYFYPVFASFSESKAQMKEENNNILSWVYVLVPPLVALILFKFILAFKDEDSDKLWMYGGLLLFTSSLSPLVYSVYSTIYS